MTIANIEGSGVGASAGNILPERSDRHGKSALVETAQAYPCILPLELIDQPSSSVNGTI